MGRMELMAKQKREREARKAAKKKKGFTVKNSQIGKPSSRRKIEVRNTTGESLRKRRNIKVQVRNTTGASLNKTNKTKAKSKTKKKRGYAGGALGRGIRR